MAQPCTMRGPTPGNCSGSRRVEPRGAPAERRCGHHRMNELPLDSPTYDDWPSSLPPGRYKGVVPTGALWVLFETLVLTGLRLGEALALEWGDLNHKQHVIKVSRSLEKNGKVTGLPSASAAAKRPRTERLKSLGSQRNVPLVADLAARLNAHRNIFEASGSGHHDRIFPSAVFNMRRMQDLWSRAVAATGIPHATVHDLRHTFAIHALDGGTQINDLQAILGHSNLTMVMRYLRRRSNTNTAQSGEAVAALMLQARVPSSGV